MNKKWLFLLLIPLLIFLPQIASTPLGKPLFTKALEHKSQSQVEIGSLKLSWFGPQKFHQLKWSHDSVTGTIEEFEIAAPFWSFSGPFHLKNGTIRYKEGAVEQIQGQIEGNDFVLNGITLQGHLALKGKVYSKLHFQIQIDIKNFPLIVIGYQLDKILGPTLDLEGFVAMKDQAGEISADISAANLKTTLKANLTPEALTLSQPLIAHIRLTPELNSFLFKNTRFLTGIIAPNPVTLRIEPQDFSFPLPYSLEKLKVSQATLDLGKVRCLNGPSLAAVISLLKATPLSQAKQVNGWFTPTIFSIQNGILTTGRTDILLADSIHICTWGSINLLKDQLDMNIGLPADTLAQSFGIKNLPLNYVMKIPVRGTTQNPEIVKGPAAAKIAALIATGQIPKKGWLSGVAEIFSNPKQEADIPPAKRPFPWEK